MREATCLLGVLVLGACTNSSRERLSVFAAASLRETFTALEQELGTDVALTFAGSQVLRLQIEQGAPADIYASGDPSHMQALMSAGLAHDARPFANNELVVIVPPDNPAGIHSFADLPGAERLVLGADTCPVGIYTAQLLERAAAHFGRSFRRDVLTAVVSRESNARLVRAKVELGEADAAIVYRTDTIACPGVRVVSIPESLFVHTEYVIGLVTGARHPELARRFLDLLDSEAGRNLLREHGFRIP